VLRTFELRLLAHLGLQPELDVCVACGAEVGEPGTALDGVRGGAVCPACAAPGPGVVAVSREALALLRTARDAPGLAQAPPDGGPGAADARDAMLAMLLAHIGKPLKSVEFIAKMSRSPG
jgi:DNA repair protein RecO (recombination protein O)